MTRPLLAAAGLVCAALFLCSCSRGDAPKEPPKTYQMSERVSLPPLQYSVFETRWQPQLGEGTDARLPQYRFFLVRISVTNAGTADAFVPGLTLEDDAGASYAELQNGDNAPHWIGYLRPMKANTTLAGNVLFDCPPKHYKLKVTNEDGKAAYVDLPLSFENPDNAVDVLQKTAPGQLSHPK